MVPAWGVSQTGYTSLDININLDLRKWSTYIIPPVSFDAEKLEQTVSQNITRTLKVEVRDMTAPNFVRNPIEIVQVPDDLSRDTGAQYLWFDEFAQKRKRIEFNKFGCNVFKLPANIYDPNGFRTDKNGIPTLNKGVWLAAYQFKMFIDSSQTSRATGTYSYWNGKFYSRSHFDLNNVAGNDQATSSVSAPPQIGTFPYEKPWSAVYPEPYSIPKKPVNQRFYGGSGRMLHPSSTVGNPIYYAAEPAYSDGDLVGNEVFNPDGTAIAGGFGVQNQASAWFYNRIANVATKNYMYKYEKGVAWSERYANGFEPYWTQTNNPLGNTAYPFAGASTVVGGEKYQRVECGYGYFLKPQGWSRVARASWGADINFDTGYLNNSNVNNPGPAVVYPGIVGGFYSHEYTYLTLYNLDNQNLTLAMNPGTYYPEGTLDLYRIVESGIDNIVESKSFVIPTYMRFVIKKSKFCWRFFLKNRGDIKVSFRNSFNGFVTTPTGSVAAGGTITLEPGQECYTSTGGANSTIQYTTTSLPGNAGFNSQTNKYDSAIYEVRAVLYPRTDAPEYDGPIEYDNRNIVFTDTTTSPVTFYGSADVLGTQELFLRTHTTGSNNGLVHEGITKDFFYHSQEYYNNDTVLYYSLKIEPGPSLDGVFNDGGDYGFGHYI